MFAVRSAAAHPTDVVDEHARALEEQWIDSLDGGSSASLASSQPAVSSLHNGIVIGFFFPLIPLFSFRGSKPAVFWDDGSEFETMSQPVFSYVHLRAGCRHC